MFGILGAIGKAIGGAAKVGAVATGESMEVLGTATAPIAAAAEVGAATAGAVSSVGIEAGIAAASANVAIAESITSLMPQAETIAVVGSEVAQVSSLPLVESFMALPEPPIPISEISPTPLIVPEASNISTSLSETPPATSSETISSTDIQKPAEEPQVPKETIQEEKPQSSTEKVEEKKPKEKPEEKKITREEDEQDKALALEVQQLINSLANAYSEQRSINESIKPPADLLNYKPQQTDAAPLQYMGVGIRIYALEKMVASKIQLFHSPIKKVSYGTQLYGLKMGGLEASLN